MLDLLYPAVRPLLFSLDAEHAHALTLATIGYLDRLGLLSRLVGTAVNAPVTLLGHTWRNRVGLAAGLDKNAAHLPALARLGFGFIELGTVTPLPQPGNRKPRLFRLPAAQALINRFGFNNVGLEQFLANLEQARRRHEAALDGVVVGLNIGKNATTALSDAATDYRIGYERVAAHADYVTVNISSPNTADLRRLQDGDELTALLAALDAQRAVQCQRKSACPPLLLKISPDLDEAGVGRIAAAIRRYAIDGVIATNTTTARTAVAGLPSGEEVGGLSGAPVASAARQTVNWLRAALPPRFPIIGVGGILEASEAQSRVTAGADLVQLYTGLVYRGPGLIAAVARALASNPGAAREG